MASVRRVGGDVRVSLTGEEAALLDSLAGQVTALVGTAGGDDGDPLERLVGLSESPPPVSDDPAVRRLLPDAYADRDSAAEFRRLMDGELRAAKAAALQRIRDDVAGGRPVRLDPAGAEEWLRALTDLRLVVGTRLHITDDDDALHRRVDPDDPSFGLFVVYDWLSALQDRLVTAVMGDD